jgi:hypothetical protein
MTRRKITRRIQLGVAAIATIGASAMSAVPAQASLLTTTDCQAAPISQPVSIWGDTSDYVLAPGGAFSGATTNWSLSGNARLLSGGEPFDVSGTPAASSLALPAGASVQSPSFCVNGRYPTFRFFGRNDSLTSTVLVQVVYRLPLLGQIAVPVGIVALGGAWQPSAIMLTGSGLPAALTTGQAEVALRFTALLGSSQIDDVFVDPRMGR